VTTTLDEAVHHVHHPGRTLTAWRALTTRLVLVELGRVLGPIWNRSKARSYLSEPSNSGNQISTLVHDDDRTRSETRLCILQGVIVHSGKGR
jgi:hypothetical protein